MEQHPNLAIQVVDTLNVSMCQGWIALESACAVLEGSGLHSHPRLDLTHDPRSTHDPDGRHTALSLSGRAHWPCVSTW